LEVQLRTFFQVNVYVKTGTYVTATRTPVTYAIRNMISHTVAYGGSSTAEKSKNTGRTGDCGKPNYSLPRGIPIPVYTEE